ncbi:D-alanyl-D-alanine carboxypeptidase [Microbacterium sp. 1P10UB]|uniref:D-alanyl-D-alanine carboxypeptidase family protein n=1 Tax=unclassified Microbacterium TaxID=2609290 RepID=UPI0039A05A41
MSRREDAASAPFDDVDAFADLMREQPDPPADGEWVDDPRRRRARRRRGLIIALVLLLVLVGAPVAYAAWALNAPVAAPVGTMSTPQVAAAAPVALTLPAEGATAISVSGGEAYLGDTAAGIWAANGGDDPRPIASITKLVTAMVILDAIPLAGSDDPWPTITFTKADHDLYDEYYVQGATIAPMPTGDTLSLHDALATMLIPSASNYADAVSRWVFGSQGAFVDAARAWLDAQGLTGTTIVEPTGLSPDNTSRPSELITIGKLAAANPVISQIAATGTLALRGPGFMVNTNSLLGRDGVTGLKTGTFGLDSYNLLFTAALDVGIGAPLQVTGVRMGGATRDSTNADVLALLSSIRAGFHEVPVSTAGQEIGSFTTAWGASATLVLRDAASVLTWSDTPITASLSTTAPVTYRDGEEIGSMTWTAGPNTATSVVEVEGDIEPPTEWWRLTHPTELGLPWGPPPG